MRHRGDSNRKSAGPIRSVARGILFLLLTPVMLVVGIVMLPFVLIARLFGLRPGSKFARHGCGAHRRGRDDGSSGDQADGPAAAQV
jgi:hypothetical protein